MDRPLAAAPPDLRALFADHYLDLVRLAVQLVDDPESAEDVVQEVFLHLQAKGSSLTADDPLRYLRTAVLNGARSTLRRRRTLRAFRRPRPMHVAAADAASLAKEEQQRILASVAQLPPRQREVIALRYYLELPVPEVAALLRISPGAVSASASVALKSLSTILGGRHA